MEKAIKGDARAWLGADTLWMSVKMPCVMTGRSGVHCASAFKCAEIKKKKKIITILIKKKDF